MTGQGAQRQASPRAARAAAPARPARTARARPSAPAGRASKTLEGRGPTPPAELRTKHPAAPQRPPSAPPPATARSRGGANPASAQPPGRPQRRPARSARKAGADAPETVVGRNPVVEALRAKVPATALYVALGIDADERVTEAVALAGKARRRAAWRSAAPSWTG